MSVLSLLLRSPAVPRRAETGAPSPMGVSEGGRGRASSVRKKSPTFAACLGLEFDPSSTDRCAGKP